jgi:hypothetical protein
MRTLRQNPLLAALLAAAFVSSFSLSAASAPPDDAASTATAPARPLSIHFAGGDRKLDRAALKSALETELGQSIMLTDSPDAALRVEVVARDRVSVAYRAPDGQTLSRSVDLPAEDDRAVEVIAWLSGNLARDEASDLLRSLRGDSPASEPAASAETASTTPAPAPEPAKPAAEPPKPAPKPAAKDSTQPKPPALRPLVFNASLFHPLSIFRDAHERRVNFELGLIYSHPGAIDGVAITPGVLEVEQGVRGAALGSLWFSGAGDNRGFLLSSFGSYRSGALVGAEVAGATTLGRGPLTGFSIAGAFGLSGPATGVTVAGAALVGGGVNGLSIAGAATVQQGDSHGVLIGGAATVAQHVDGLSIAGAVNHAGEADGVQIAGVVNSAATLDGFALGTVNVHGKVRGLQLGVINIAEEVDGAALGVVSIAKNGRVQPIAYWSSFAPAHAGVKFVVGWGYSEIGMGFAGDEYMPEAGMGAHIPVWENVYIEPGAHFSSTHPTDSDQNAKHVDSHYRLRAGVRLLDAVEVFAGGGARHGIWGETENEWKPEILAGVAIF